MVEQRVGDCAYMADRRGYCMQRHGLDIHTTMTAVAGGVGVGADVDVDVDVDVVLVLYARGPGKGQAPRAFPRCCCFSLLRVIVQP